MSTVSNRVVALFGPTASGKTDILSRVFAGGRLRTRPAVVVSADSVQVYRGLNVGSAKPSSELLAELPHELVDVREPDEAFSVGDFVRLADEACERAVARGDLPVISGGTAFYVKAFIVGLPSAPAAEPGLRAALQAELAERGAAAMHAELALVDPVSAARIAVADAYRIGRALEVYRGSGRPLSSYVPPGAPRRCWEVLAFAVDRPRAELYARIEARVDGMMAGGLPEEFRSLVDRGYGAADPGLRAIGYAEFFEAGEGDPYRGLDRLDEVSRLIKLHTRRYAKRQLTFMRALPGLRWIRPDEADALPDRIEAWLARPAERPLDAAEWEGYIDGYGRNER